MNLFCLFHYYRFFIFSFILLSHFVQALLVFCLQIIYLYRFPFILLSSWLPLSYIFICCSSLRGPRKLTVNCISNHVSNLRTRSRVTPRPAAVNGQIYDDRRSQLTDKVQLKWTPVERRLKRMDRPTKWPSLCVWPTIHLSIKRSTWVLRQGKALMHLAHRNINMACGLRSFERWYGGETRNWWGYEKRKKSEKVFERKKKKERK